MLESMADSRARSRYARWPGFKTRRSTHDDAGELPIDKPKPPSHIETLAALVLSIAAVATAWSAYQSTRWSGIMATSFNEAGALRSESVRASNEAGVQTQVDVTIAADWLWATLDGEDLVAVELRKRMSPELDEAMKLWLGDWQADQPLPDGGPFEDDYVLPTLIQSQELEARAEEQFAAARSANQRSDNYVLTGVLFALALFFAGISSRVSAPRMTQMVYAASALMAIGILLLVLQPKSFGI